MARECAGQVAAEDVWERVPSMGSRGVSCAENAVEALALGGRCPGGGTGAQRPKCSRTKERRILLAVDRILSAAYRILVAVDLITDNRDYTDRVKDGLRRP